MANVDINREIARIRALPGQNWHAIAFQTLQNYINSLTFSTAAATATTSAAATAKAIIGSGGSPVSPAAASIPFELSVNGAPAAGNSANLNNALPSPATGSATVSWQIDNTVEPPNISGSYVSLANSLITANIVPFSATPVFDALLGNVQEITLTAAVTSFTIINPTPGQVMTLIWLQDATGGWTVAGPPATLRGFTTPGTTLSTYSVQSFAWDGMAWVATSAGIVNI